jgi:hypothetical protein
VHALWIASSLHCVSLLAKTELLLHRLVFLRLFLLLFVAMITFGHTNVTLTNNALLLDRNLNDSFRDVCLREDYLQYTTFVIGRDLHAQLTDPLTHD